MRDALLETVRLNKALLLAAGLLAVVTLGLFVAVVSFQEPAIVEAQAKWNDLRRKVAVIGRGDVTTAYKKGQADLLTITERVPLKRDFPRVLGDLMESASENGVAIGGFTYKPEIVKGEKLLAYGLTMKISGRYAAVKSYLTDLLESQELIVVDGISLTNGDPFEEDVVMELHLTIYLREAA